ncbi:STAS-like domain-containing protein [Desulfofundulus thermosubterraneus]|jgi:hypothetical protein|uniref:DUF4325 domain-containing protein n=1 Tax=Desulfofundulus thermosubterraneus DSM 16057 TaxID=1121432 RepID=A0A1M6AS05_9FIRM|nr:STAS-like domain-containing protein [Desulfofundulus thermosubterraneus]SHI39118.1 protein of unknown function [Desulfofundulus thermosubterraneus DSM 16057]
MIILKNFGSHLTSRTLGKKVRLLILEKLNLSSPNSVILDFANVEMASHSFCDEAFGKLLKEVGLERFKRSIKFWNCSEEIESTIRFVLKERLMEEKELCATC